MSERSYDWNGDERRAHPAPNGTLLKIMLAIIGSVLTILASALGWTMSYMLETRSISNLNTATLQANTAAVVAVAARQTVMEAELHRIALIQAERTAIIERAKEVRR